MSPYTEGPRFATVSHDDHGPILSILAWFLMVVFVLATLLKLTVRATAKGLGLDDVFLTFAMAFGIGEVVAVSIAVNHGFDQRAILLDDTQISSIVKSLYASSILYLLTLAFAKAAIIQLMSRLFPDKHHVKINRILCAVVLAWTLGSIFGAAFQCGIPHPWGTLGRGCSERHTFWYTVGAFDMAIDLVLIVAPVLVIWSLQMSTSRKVAIASVFALRFFVIAAQITRLVLLPGTGPQSDPTYPIAFWVATQSQIALAVTVASATALKPFMDRMSSGFWNASLESRTGTYDVSGVHGSRQGSKQADSKGSGQSGGKRKPPGEGPQMVVTSKSSSKNGIEHTSLDAGASDQYAIRKTTGYEVTHEDGSRSTTQLPTAGHDPNA